MQHTTQHNTKGFTILELLVSLSVFIIVMLISMGAVITILDSNKKAASLQASVDNANFVLDVMSREIRFGTEFVLSGDKSTLSFTRSDDKSTTYQLTNGVIERSVAGVALPLTFGKFSVDMLLFDLTYTGGQPLVTIYIKGKSGAGSKLETLLDMQTSISPRTLSPTS